MDIRIAGTVNDSIVDGPGFRFTVFVQGCSHCCPGCQNPQTWSRDGGEMSTTEEILARIDKNPLLRGVTLSGGEPFESIAPMAEIARSCHERGLDVWCYTGYLYEDIAAGKLGEEAIELLELCDVLVDGLFIEDQKTLGLRFRGSANQRLIDVPASLAAGEACLLPEG